ncbi:hypothetical protein GVC57_001847 [Salmonella enterica]|nr:hypothetical protein [Salmonella enterica]EAZ6144723.1 hypothetical protein [Salmonella enterica]EBD6703626.1 hypothetical protein [Salmonella enterica]EBS7931511.1 hypothetical protein [Salmonella enterica]ECR5015871.1 hypothetical protein [Salmonella enterica]
MLPAGAALIRLQYSLVIERISVAAIRYSVSSLAFLISDQNYQFPLIIFPRYSLPLRKTAQGS